MYMKNPFARMMGCDMMGSVWYHGLRAIYTGLSLAGAFVYLILFGLMRQLPFGVVCVWEHNPVIYGVEVEGLLLFLVGGAYFLYRDLHDAVRA